MTRISIEQASELLGVNVRMARALCDAGLIGITKKNKTNNTYLVWKEWVEDLMQKRGAK